MSYLKIRGTSKRFAEKVVLNNIDIEINKGEFLCLLGPSGCGKTTLLRIIAGLEEVDEGKVFLQDTDITNLPPDKRGFGIVFQSYALFPNMTGYKNIVFALKQKKLSDEEINRRTNEVLELVGLKNEAHKYPKELSGGQQQRIAIARALALKPKFLLLDEPMSALDAKVRNKLRMDIKKLQRELGITTIMVTHDQEEAITMGDRIAILNEGNIMQIGKPQEVYQKPSNLFTAKFIGETNCFDIGGNIYAVRPEHIQISKRKIIGYEGKILNIEFRGNTFRAEIEPKHKDISSVVICDISIKEWVNLGVSLGEEIYFDINKEYYLKYPKAKGA